MAEMVKIVRCVDCIYWTEPSKAEKEDGCNIGKCCDEYGPCNGQQTDMTWFCADGAKQ